MRVAILRRTRGISFSMDVYADGLVHGLKAVRPDWDIVELAPQAWWEDKTDGWKAGSGLQKYYERFWNHPRAASRLTADIFHIIDHSSAHVAYWLQKKKSPVIITCHDLVQRVYPEILRDQSRIPALSLAVWNYSVRGMEQSDRIISVSSNTAKDISKFLKINSEKITVIPNAVEPGFSVLSPHEIEKLRQVFRPNPKGIYLLNVGSTHQRKNILTVLQALKTLRDKEIPVYLWRVGGPLTAEQKAFVQQHSLHHLIIDLGLPDRTKLIQIYNSADLLLAPSLYEGFGLTILEAMACGLPVITSNTSSLPEVAADAAVLLDPLDIQGIVSSVLQITSHPETRHTLIHKGLARSKKFTWEHTAEQVAHVYESALKEVDIRS